MNDKVQKIMYRGYELAKFYLHTRAYLKGSLKFTTQGEDQLDKAKKKIDEILKSA